MQVGNNGVERLALEASNASTASTANTIVQRARSLSRLRARPASHSGWSSTKRMRFMLPPHHAASNGAPNMPTGGSLLRRLPCASSGCGGQRSQASHGPLVCVATGAPRRSCFDTAFGRMRSSAPSRRERRIEHFAHLPRQCVRRESASEETRSALSGRRAARCCRRCSPTCRARASPAERGEPLGELGPAHLRHDDITEEQVNFALCCSEERSASPAVPHSITLYPFRVRMRARRREPAPRPPPGGSSRCREAWRQRCGPPRPRHRAGGPRVVARGR
jgi:Tfp pilus assembly protein FimV